MLGEVGGECGGDRTQSSFVPDALDGSFRLAGLRHVEGLVDCRLPLAGNRSETLGLDGTGARLHIELLYSCDDPS